MDMTILLMDVAPNSDKLPAANSVLNLVHNHDNHQVVKQDFQMVKM